MQHDDEAEVLEAGAPLRKRLLKWSSPLIVPVDASDSTVGVL